MTIDIVGKIVALDDSLTAANIGHAFGGALALAWCTRRARGTIDIDLNVFVDATLVRPMCEALPAGVDWDESDVDGVARDGQIRLFWDAVPVDIFLNTSEFHDGLASRIRWESFGGRNVPFLACTDLAVFKVIFNRSKDWVDIEEMLGIGSLDVEVVLGVLVRYLGAHDSRISRLEALARSVDEIL